MRKQNVAFIFKGNNLVKTVACTVDHGYLTTKEKKPMHVLIPRPVYENPRESLDLKPLEPLPPNATPQQTREIQERNSIVQAENSRLIQDAMEVEEANLALRKMDKEVTRVHGFEGSPGLRAFFLYDGIGLAVNPETILGLDAEGDYRVVELPEGTMANGGGLGKLRNMLIRVFLPINPEAVKKFLGKTIDQAILDGMYQDGVEEGRKTSNIDKDKKMILYLIIMGIAVIGLMIVAAKFL
jgi:hypothetical protein